MVDMKEEWRAINGFPGYEVSNLGNFRTFRKPDKWHGYAVRELPKPLTLHQDKRWGYWHLGLRRRNGKRVNLLAHKLVAEAFIGPCPEGMEVNHKDGLKEHNYLENLEYATPSENHQHARRLGLIVAARGTEIGLSKLNEKKVLSIRAARKRGAKLTDLAREYGVAFQTISNICLGKSWSWL